MPLQLAPIVPAPDFVCGAVLPNSYCRRRGRYLAAISVAAQAVCWSVAWSICTGNARFHRRTSVALTQYVFFSRVCFFFFFFFRM